MRTNGEYSEIDYIMEGLWGLTTVHIQPGICIAEGKQEGSTRNRVLWDLCALAIAQVHKSSRTRSMKQCR